VKLFIAFLFVFLILGLFTPKLGGWGYFVIALASTGLTGLYIASSSVW
jgi:hypothetical protein